jgi:hypothetical protein
MGIFDWARKNFAALSLAMSSVEKEVLSQDTDLNTAGTNQVQRLTQGRLSDALVRGEVTQEVRDLRWRMYKVLMATNGVNAEITGYDDDGMPIVKVSTKKRPITNVMVDSIDDYEVELVVDNSEILSSTLEGVDNDALKEVDNDPTITDDEDSITIGEIDGERFMTNVKGVRPVVVTYPHKPKFEIDNYSDKVIVRTISETEKMIEVYVSSYPDEFDRKTRLLVSTLKKAMNNPRIPTLEMETLGFITNKTMGAADFMLYNYKIEKIDKVIEFDGNFVIKYIATPIINGENILESFKEEDLEERYKNKEAK